jgi:uncharacterized Zn-binding protein involved in type VI secretion
MNDDQRPTANEQRISSQRTTTSINGQPTTINGNRHLTSSLYLAFSTTKSFFMKSVLLLVVASFAMLFASAQADKSKRPSPPALVKETLASGAVVSIDYSQPSVKGRTIGTDLEPMDGKVWRTGANEATVFEVSKDVKVEGKALPAGKYSLYSVVNGGEWTIIFNKTWKQWGTVYSEAEDALRVKAKSGKATEFAEKMTFAISKAGVVTLLWGNNKVDFKVE